LRAAGATPRSPKAPSPSRGMQP